MNSERARTYRTIVAANDPIVVLFVSLGAAALVVAATIILSLAQL